MSNFIITVIVAVVSALLASFLSLQIKFCESKEDAYRGIKSFLSRLVQVVSNLFIIGVIVWFLISKDPISRVDIFLLMLCFCSITISIIGFILNQLLVILKETNFMQQQLSEAAMQHLGVTEDLNGIVGRVVKEIEKTANQSTHSIDGSAGSE
jgi:hypothetical protein